MWLERELGAYTPAAGVRRARGERARIELDPLVHAGEAAAAAAAHAAPSGPVDDVDHQVGPTRSSVTVTGTGPAWRPTLVSASWTIRTS